MVDDKFLTINNRPAHKKLAWIFLWVFCWLVCFAYQHFLISSHPLSFYLNTTVAILFALSLAKPKASFYIFIFLIPLLNSIPKIAGVPELDIIIFLFLPIWLGYLVKKANWHAGNSPRMLRSKIGIPIITISAIVLISAVITIFRNSNFYPLITNNFYNLTVNLYGVSSIESMLWTGKFFINYLVGLGMLIVVFDLIKTKRDIITAILILISSTMISFLVILYQYLLDPLFGNLEPWAQNGRLNATFTDPNALGNFTILLFPIFLILIFYYKKAGKKIIAIFLFVALLAMVLLSGSRSAFIGIFSSLMFILFIFFRDLKVFLSSKRNKLIFFIPLSLLVIIALIGLFLIVKRPGFIAGIGLIDKLAETAGTAIKFYRKDGLVEAIKSISNYRYIYWQQAIVMAKDFPLTGIGIGNYIVELPQYIIKTGAYFFQVDFAGNYYLQVVSELGLVGLFLVLYLYYMIIKKAVIYFKTSNKNRLLAGGLFSSFLAMLVVFNLGAHTNIGEIQLTFWLIIGLLLAAIRAETMRSYRMKTRIFSLESFGYKRIIPLLIILIIFSGLFFKASFEELSINVKQSGYEFENEYGFYDQFEENGVIYQWTAIDASKVIQKETDTIIIPMRAANPDITDKPLQVKIFINNSLMDELTFNDDRWYDVAIDLSYLKRDQFTLTLVCSRDWVQRDWGVGSSNKELGVLIEQWYFK